MSRFYNWKKLGPKRYQYDPNPALELRLLNPSEVEEVGVDWPQWVLAIFDDGEFEQVTVYGLEGFKDARRAAKQWMQTHPHIEVVV